MRVRHLEQHRILSARLHHLHLPPQHKPSKLLQNGLRQVRSVGSSPVAGARFGFAN